MLLGNGLADRAAERCSGQELREREELSEDGEEREGLRRQGREKVSGAARAHLSQGCTVKPIKSCPRGWYSQGSKYCVSTAPALKAMLLM